MVAPPSVPKHGRPGKPMPPVYGTAVPLHGLSGLIRKAAYRYPDHVPAHWLLLLLGDRVDAWSLHARRSLPFAAPTALAVILGARALRRRRR